ncbi:MAG: hypothetical protein IJE07_08660 [Clostridia bacterium]|nr:hypothetical protein [Clostridia bacterium]
MEKKIKSPVVSEQERIDQRKRQIRNWAILLGCIAAAVILTVVISLLGSSGHSITSTRLPCYAHQDVTVFQDGVLYYDGASIHFINANGSIEWSYPAGDGASFSASDSNIIVWADRQLAILNDEGYSTYNRAMDESIQFARIGQKHAAIITGDELTSTVFIKDLQGAHIDSETTQFDGQVLLDCGFYGSSDQYMWTLSYDFYAPIVTSILATFQVGSMNTGSATLTNHLPTRVVYLNERLHAFTTQQLYTYDYRGVEDTSGNMLVYGWQYLAHTQPKRGLAYILLAPTNQATGESGMKDLRVISTGFDRRYSLPSTCVGAAMSGESIYAFSSQYLYSGKISSQRFYAHQIQLEDGRSVTDFVGLTSNGYAIVVSNNEVYSVTLPK